MSSLISSGSVWSPFQALDDIMLGQASPQASIVVNAVEQD
jgi:hypothetical protein